MKAAPTLDGRLRIDVETELDVVVLKSVVGDAAPETGSLAEKLADGMAAEVDADWREFVLPDLRELYGAQVATVARALADLSPGTAIFVARDEAESWYGAFNQARLALEERYRLSHKDGAPITPERRTAVIRSHFYQVIQGMLLEFLMKE